MVASWLLCHFVHTALELYVVAVFTRKSHCHVTAWVHQQNKCSYMHVERTHFEVFIHCCSLSTPASLILSSSYKFVSSVRALAPWCIPPADLSCSTTGWLLIVFSLLLSEGCVRMLMHPQGEKVCGLNFGALEWWNVAAECWLLSDSLPESLHCLQFSGLASV